MLGKPLVRFCEGSGRNSGHGRDIVAPLGNHAANSEDKPHPNVGGVPGLLEYFRTVRGDTRPLGLSSNSLAIRSSPQDALLKAISRISCEPPRVYRLSSMGIGGRPDRDFQRQNRRKP